uniref:Uncharacterized protein n=1 Tax=Siphoviridae sp. ctnsL8 TaxID=2825666 RepID=A0A8S5PML6_9CAUD|nr:MAG TPA: hypothetical protein [Siphoviridae sp. ctnsL8]
MLVSKSQRTKCKNLAITNYLPTFVIYNQLVYMLITYC